MMGEVEGDLQGEKLDTDAVRVFRVRRSCRLVGWVYLLGFGVGTTALPLIGMVDENPSRRVATAVMLMPMTFAVLATWRLVARQKGILMIRGSELRWSGKPWPRTLDLRRVTRLRWPEFEQVNVLFPENSRSDVALAHPRGPFRLNLSNYERADRRAIIAHLHETLPVEVQVNWARFAYRIAKPRQWKGRFAPEFADLATNPRFRAHYIAGLLLLVTTVMLGVLAAMVEREPQKHWIVACAAVSAFITLVECCIIEYQTERIELDAAEAWASGEGRTFDPTKLV